MKKSKLLALTLALLISFGAITGSTIAWFTDEVTSANNIIKSGALDVDVYCGNPADKESIQNKTTLFNDVTLWEPGAVAWENLTVVNTGTLSFQYEMVINAINENKMTDGTDAQLSQVLKVGFVDGLIDAAASREEVIAKIPSTDWKTLSELKTKGMLLPVEHSHIKDENVPAGAVVGSKSYGMVIWWEPTANDNKWNVNNGKTTDDSMPYLHIDLGLNVRASQLTAEADSFDHLYDGKSFKDTMDEFANSSDKVEEKVELGRDETITDDTITVKEDDDIIIDLKGHKLTVKNVVDKDCIVVNTGATLTITDSVGGGELNLVTSGSNNNEIYVVNNESGKTATLNITGDAKITLPGDSKRSDMILVEAKEGDAVLNLRDTAKVEVGGEAGNVGIVAVNATVTMEDKSRIDVVGTDAYGIYVVNGGTATIKEDAHIYVEGDSYETGIEVAANGTVNMEGGSITAVYITDTQKGRVNGAYLASDTAVFNMSGGVITAKGKHCTTGICSSDKPGTINVTGGTFHVEGEITQPTGYNLGISAASQAKLNVSGATFNIRTTIKEGVTSMAKSSALEIGRNVAVNIGDGVKVNITNADKAKMNNFAFCDYNSTEDFSLVPMTDMVSAAGNGGGRFDDRLNGTVPLLVKGVQLDNDNYNTIFNDMIQW